jgi:hypothetical protein
MNELAVKRFLSLFCDMYICFNSNCISACEPQDFVTIFAPLSLIHAHYTHEVCPDIHRFVEPSTYRPPRILVKCSTGGEMTNRGNLLQFLFSIKRLEILQKI